MMDVRKILSELKREMLHIQAAIAALEQLQTGERRRGRPPAWLAAIKREQPAMLPGSARRGSSRPVTAAPRPPARRAGSA